MLFLYALLACKPGSADVASGDPADTRKPLVADAAPAFDPLRGPLAWRVEGPSGASVTVAINQDGAELWSTQGVLDDGGGLSGTWDASNSPPQAGLLTLTVRDGLRQALDETVAVRASLSGAVWGDDGGDQAHRELLYWRGDRVVQDPSVGVAAAEGADFPEVSEELAWQPTDGRAEPVAYRFDSRPLLTLQAPTSSSLGGTGLDDAVVEVVIEGWTAVGGAELAPGGTVTLQRDEPLSASVGWSDERLELRFEAVDAESGERHDLGSQALPARIYRVVGPQTTGFDVPESHPWLLAIDPALRAIDGTVGSHAAVVDALVDWIYNDLGLVYDTAAGASFYSDYVWFNWDQPHFFLSEFLQRQNGLVVNCSDSANILSTHANMLGAELVHIVILENYNLNEIKAVGQPGYTSCPFGAFGCGFSYHAVTTNSPDGATIWDTTLALDGDNDPGSAPHTELLVQTLTGEEYLSRLVRSGAANYDFPARVTFE